MADPISMALMGVGMAGTGLQVAGQLGQADTYSRLADIDTEALKEEADINNQQAYEQARITREQGRYLQGEQRVSAAAGGIRADQGSPLLLAMKTARNVELDAITQEWQGQYGKKMAERQGALIQYDKRLKKRDATWATVGTILGGAMNAGGIAAGGAGGAPKFGGKG